MKSQEEIIRTIWSAEEAEQILRDRRKEAEALKESNRFCRTPPEPPAPLKEPWWHTVKEILTVLSTCVLYVTAGIFSVIFLAYLFSVVEPAVSEYRASNAQQELLGEAKKNAEIKRLTDSIASAGTTSK